MNKDKKQTENKNDEIEQLNAKIEELENNWKRALADYINLQNRVADLKEDYISFAYSSILQRFLPILDNLEMVEKHVDDMGIKLVVKEFKQILSDEGVVEIKSENQDFDIETMEATETVEGEKGKVVEVVKKGYLYKEKLLRPAYVKVGHGAEKE
ncbi:MAG: nucleotide exchange factor GrpE [Patescibacteria group bacterium]